MSDSKVTKCATVLNEKSPWQFWVKTSGQVIQHITVDDCPAVRSQVLLKPYFGARFLGGPGSLAQAYVYTT